MDREHKPSREAGGGGGGSAPESTVGKVSSAHEEASGDPVDQALAAAGGGAPHPSGATVHSDPTAHAAAKQLNAVAFAAGKDVYLGEGQNPGSEAGDRVMKHELAHVEQTRGLTPPKPGSYRVASPSEPAEVAATAAETGGDGNAAAEGGTIYRKTIDSEGNVHGAGPEQVDKLQEFFDALAANSVADAQAKWKKLPAKDKARMRAAGVAKYPSALKADPVESILEIMAKEGLGILKETKALWDKVTYADTVLEDPKHDATYWMSALKGASVYNQWLAKLPDHAALGEKRADKLDAWMTISTTITDTKQIFHHAYPKLMDASYNKTFLKAAKWAVPDVKRMWSSLQGKVPLAHAQTIAGGFNLGTHEKLFTKNNKGKLIWAPLNFGWHHPGPNVIVMNQSSSNKTEGGTGHNMTGGGGSGVAVAGTAADPQTTHWDGTMLHEIGHGVGDKTDGNDFAKKHGDWKGGMGWDDWSKKLFDDAAATKAIAAPPPKKILAAADAREFLAKEVAGGSFLPAKWKRPDVVAFINTHYATQKLVGYWSKVKGGKVLESYYVDGDNDGGDKRTYAWLARGGLAYTSYKKEISDNKVSWYSISSTVEWFAEQYANYYRTGKAAPGADATTKAKLDTIDKMDATATGGLAAPSPAPGAEAGGGEGATPEGDPHAKGGGPAPQQDTSAAAAAAAIRRMNF